MADGGDVIGELPQGSHQEARRVRSIEIPPLDKVCSPQSPVVPVAPQSFHRRGSFDLDDYFTGPRDIAKHSKWPLILQLHGSIMPKLILPLLLISIWATAITVISAKVHYLGVQSVLITVTGFVVSLSLSFRSSTAYERYTEGRKYWATLVQASQILGRVFWIHATDRGSEFDAREVLLQKLSSMNLLVAFSLALKHSLRFEPYTAYPDLQNLIGHLDTFAKSATEAQGSISTAHKKKFFRGVGEYLGVSFAASNPRKAIKKASRPLGNLPLEILSHLAVTIDTLVANEQLRVPIHQTMAFNALQSLNDVMTGTERVLCTPLPIAYTIAISQSTYLYIALLPFQLIPLLQWTAIPATIAASWIILGLLFIGQEVENPFGQDVNDLPLDSYCEQIAADLDIIASFDMRESRKFLTSSNNLPLYPVSTAPVSVWMQRSEEKLREAIKQKPVKTFEWRRWGTKHCSSSAATSVAGDHNV
ncbi:hypothetical protein CDD83_8350 [Cordyceps sp. RAO-2017]|nr:hypothetical protein CDD83_8350 [Cordyceps sp. RAO-2017]